MLQGATSLASGSAFMAVPPGGGIMASPPDGSLLSKTVLWHSAAVEKLSRLHPAVVSARTTQLNWALANLYAMAGEKPDSEQYITRLYHDRSLEAVQGGATACRLFPLVESLLLHRHPRGCHAVSSRPDINNSYTWSPEFARGLCHSRHGESREQYVVANDETYFQASLYWRLMADLKPGEELTLSPTGEGDPAGDTLPDQVGIFTFCAWLIDDPAKLVFSDTGLIFSISHRGSYLWVSLLHFFEALSQGLDEVEATFYRIQDEPKVMYGKGDVKLSYHRERWFGSKPYVSMHLPHMTLTLSPRLFFPGVDPFAWEATAPIDPFWQAARKLFKV